MRDPYSIVADQLVAAGFKEVEAGCFSAPHYPRTVALSVCSADPQVWRHKAEEMLRIDPMRLTAIWARYVVLIVDSAKTQSVAWAAAAFARDVAKCRRIILFADPSDATWAALPFGGLPPISEDSGTPVRDVEAVVHRVLTSTALADVFLDENLPTSQLQTMAEEQR